MNKDYTEEFKTYDDKLKEKDYLNRVLRSYYYQKNIANNAKKMADSLNKEIKNYMNENQLQAIRDGDIHFIVDLKVKEKEEWVEELLLVKLKDLGFNELIKTKECVDYEKLEKYLYLGKILKREIQVCSKTNKTEYLFVKSYDDVSNNFYKKLKKTEPEPDIDNIDNIDYTNE